MLTVKLIRNALAAAAASAAAFYSVLSVSAFELERHYQDDIREMYQRLYFDIHSGTEYTKAYSTSSPTNAGELSKDTLEEGLNSVNFCRYLAGLPYDVELDDEYNKLAQHASLIININDVLSHDPKKPAVMSDEVYALAKSGAGQSNIGIGYMNIQESMLEGYMSDTDSHNISTLGHRRWILNPDMKKTGLGMVGKGTAMYVCDRSRDDKFTGDYVCWPPYVMPYELLGNNENGYAYSVTLGKAYDKPDASKVKVTLTSKLTDKTWNFENAEDTTGKKTDKNEMVGYFAVNNDVYGTGGCIIFNPGKLPEDDVVSVTISGITKDGKESPISYKVNYFDLLDESDYTVGFDKKSYDLEVGKSMHIVGYNNPLSNGNYTVWTSTDEKDENGKTKSAKEYMTMSQSGGTADITADKVGKVFLYVGKKDAPMDEIVETEVVLNIEHKHTRGDWIVEKQATDTEDGLRYRICSECQKRIDEEVLPAKSLAAAEVKLAYDKAVYTGSAVKPAVKVYAGGKRLTEGVDYNVAYTDNDKIGTAKVTVTGMGYFSGSKSAEFTIEKRGQVSIKDTNITVNTDGLTYTGSEIKPKITIKEGSRTLVNGKDYKAEYSDNLNVGKGQVVITGMGDYIDSITYSFRIDPADIGFPWESSKLSEVKYTGQPIIRTLNLRSQVSGQLLTEGVDFTAEYKNNINVGTATITITGIGNYSGTASNTFEIVKPDDYKGPDDKDEKDEPYNAVVTLDKSVDSSAVKVVFVSEKGDSIMATVSDGSFCAKLPDGKYTAWVIKKAYAPVSIDFVIADGKTAEVGDNASLNDAKIYPYGDVNMDGSVNVTDIAIIAAHIKGIKAMSDDVIVMADVNADDGVNVTDIAMIASHIKGIKSIDTEPVVKVSVASKPSDTTVTLQMVDETVTDDETE